MRKLQTISIFLLAVLALTMPSRTVHAASVCIQAFAVNALTADELQDAIHALAKLKLFTEADRGSAASPTIVTALEKDYAKKERQLAARLRNDSVERAQDVKKLVELEIKRLQGDGSETSAWKQHEREALAVEARRVRSFHEGRRLIFHPVTPGEFEMIDFDYNKKYKKVIVKPYFLASTVTTKTVWNQILKAGINHFPQRAKVLQSLELTSLDDDLHPVTNRSFKEITIWIDVLNNLAASNDPVVTQLFPNHQARDFYRLPTEAELDFVATNRGARQESFHKSVTNAVDYAWAKTTSGGKSPVMPVATRLPLLVDKMEYFDLYGNVWQMTGDNFGKLVMGVDQFNSPVSRGGLPASATMRGGAASESIEVFSYRNGISIDERSGYTSFRLAKTSRPDRKNP